MVQSTQKQEDHPQSSDEQDKIAVPYIPPPPPDGSDQKKFRSPLVNGILIAFVILLGGFMAYNFIGHQLTQLAGETYGPSISPVPSNQPSDTPSPTLTISPSPTSAY
jgi:hypothetical protein